MKKVSVILASLLIAACSSAPKIDTHQALNSSTKTTTANMGTATNETAESKRLAALQLQKNQIQQLDKQSVYFDFDQSALKPEYQSIVQLEANFAKANSGDVLTVTGNADERGSSEYNLALGDRRAQAVAKNLQALGVKAKQIKTVSYGSTKPRALCHEEKCWQENRRADFDHNVK